MSGYTPTPAGVGTVTTALRRFALGTPAILSYDGVHADLAATEANAFPGPFTNPDVPRVLQVQISDSAAWDGGAVTVTGTDWTGAAISEVFTPSGADAPQNIVGVKAFATVVSATKAAVGATAETASVGYADSIALQTTGAVGSSALCWKSTVFPQLQGNITVDTVNKTIAIQADGANPFFADIEVTP